MSGAELVVWLVRLWAAYLTAGGLFALGFCTRGVGAVDRAARGAGLGFRLVLVPGVALLWPLLAVRWLRGEGAPPVERTAHKRAGACKP